jgi:hypothetical protein
LDLISDIKESIKKSGANKRKLIYFKPDSKIRIRFLHDMDEGMSILFHDSYKKGINVPCKEIFEKECEYCDDEELRHRKQYLWCVYDYENKEVKILMGPANNASPVPAFVGFYEAYGTLTDRDYVINRNGKGKTTTYSVVPMDRSKFRNKNAKPFSKSKILEILMKAFYEDEFKDENDEDNEEEEQELNYDEMTSKQLYKLCKERGIKVKKKQDEDYYIELLEKYDEENEDDEDDDEDEEW